MTNLILRLSSQDAQDRISGKNRPRASVLNNQEIGLNLKPRSAASPKVRKHSENSQGKNTILEATRAVTISNR